MSTKPDQYLVAGPGAAPVSTHGTPGTTSYFYKLVAHTHLGVSPAGTESSISTGNATLNGTNYNVLAAPSPNPIGVVLSYDVYRGTTSNGENILVASQVQMPYNDQGGGTSATPPSVGVNNGITTRYNVSTSTQIYTVPAGVSTVKIQCWGEPGWGNNPGPARPAGGTAAYVEGVFNVTPGQKLLVTFNQDGGGVASPTTETITGITYHINSAGQTGGQSASVFIDNADIGSLLLIAGGGGGLGGSAGGAPAWNATIGAQSGYGGQGGNAYLPDGTQGIASELLPGGLNASIVAAPGNNGITGQATGGGAGSGGTGGTIGTSATGLVMDPAFPPTAGFSSFNIHGLNGTTTWSYGGVGGIQPQPYTNPGNGTTDVYAGAGGGGGGGGLQSGGGGGAGGASLKGPNSFNNAADSGGGGGGGDGGTSFVNAVATDPDWDNGVARLDTLITGPVVDITPNPPSVVITSPVYGSYLDASQPSGTVVFTWTYSSGNNQAQNGFYMRRRQLGSVTYQVLSSISTWGAQSIGFGGRINAFEVAQSTQTFDATSHGLFDNGDAWLVSIAAVDNQGNVGPYSSEVLFIGQAAPAPVITFPPANWPGPGITQGGTPGSSSYYYVVVATLPNGNVLPSTEVHTTTGNATLNVTNYNILTWTSQGAGATYTVYRGSTPGSENVAVVTGLSALTVNDTGQGSSGSPSATWPSISNSLPTFTWTTLLAPNTTQVSYRFMIYNQSTTFGGGFSAGVTPPDVYDTGIVYSNASSFTMPTPISGGGTYVAYVVIQETGPQSNVPVAQTFAVPTSTIQVPTLTLSASAAGATPSVSITPSDGTAGTTLYQIQRSLDNFTWTTIRNAGPGSTLGVAYQDFEMPVGVTVYYRVQVQLVTSGQTVVSAFSSSSNITIPFSQYSWLSDPIAAASAIPVFVQRGNFSQVTSERQAVYQEVGQAQQAVVADVVQLPTYTITFSFLTQSQLAAFVALRATQHVLLLNMAGVVYYMRLAQDLTFTYQTPSWTDVAGTAYGANVP